MQKLRVCDEVPTFQRSIELKQLLCCCTTPHRGALNIKASVQKTNRVHLNPPPHTLSQRRRRVQRSHPHHLILVRRFNDAEPADQSLGFGLGPVGRLRLATARAQDKGGLRTFE